MKDKKDNYVHTFSFFVTIGHNVRCRFSDLLWFIGFWPQEEGLRRRVDRVLGFFSSRVGRTPPPLPPPHPKASVSLPTRVPVGYTLARGRGGGGVVPIRKRGQSHFGTLGISYFVG